MNFADIIKRDLQKIECDLGEQEFTWHEDNESYVCSPSTNSKAAALDVGGFMLQADILLTVRKELFSASYPSFKQKVTYNGTVYRIANVRTDATDTFLLLTCVEAVRWK